MFFQEKLNSMTSNPRKLFLIDGLGAILSAFLIGIVLVKFENLFGIPQHSLYFLALFPCFFAIYDFYCFLKVIKNLDLFLKGIAIANLVYCFISIGLISYHYKCVTYLGWIYIILEILILIALAIWQLKTASQIIN